MNKEQLNEWVEAHKIPVSVNLVEAAKKHLMFLAAVDQNRYLYEDPALQWAIYRYLSLWVPLLVIHLENPVSEDPLVIPLDCEWIWHCHKLNPVRYKLDCERQYGRILGNRKIISSVQASATSKQATEEIWNKMYPEEPYKLDINRPFSEDVLQRSHQNGKFTSYDLVSAVKRQIPFTFQVSRPHMSDDLFLQEALVRYKEFLHLIRTNMKMGKKLLCVPTYDIDLIWRTHQLHPDSYCKDLTKIVGKILEHYDTDSTRTKGNKLDTGYYETTRQWENTFGKRYWKAGAMYRGSSPSPVTQIASDFKYVGNDSNAMENRDKSIQFSTWKAVEVLLEFVEIENLPEDHKENVVVSFSKKQSDRIFNTKRSLSIFSESGEKQVANFLCEATGEFLFEIKSGSQTLSNKSISNSSKILGSCSLSLQELLTSRSQLYFDKWISVNPASGIRYSRPILLLVSISFTPPSPAPQVFHLEQFQPFFENSCFPSFLMRRKVKHSKAQTSVKDNDGECVCSLQMRNKVKNAEKCTPGVLKEIQCISETGEKQKVAEFLEDHWLINGTHGSFKLQNNSGNGNHIFELFGCKMVKLYPGKRLDFEPQHCENRKCKQNFITAIEFSADYPYGRAIALFDLKLGTIKALDEWMVQPGIIIAFILSDIWRREGYIGISKINADKIATSPGNTSDTMQNEVVLDDCNPERRDPSEIKDSDSSRIHPVNSGGYGGANCDGSMVE